MAFSDVEQIPLQQQINYATASAKNQMAFQREMSDTAHQREVKDLQAAGLNPILSAGGSGASTPTGAEGDYSGAVTMQTEMAEAMKSLSQSVARTSGKAVAAVEGVAKTIEEIWSKYEVDEDQKVNSIISAAAGEGEDWILDQRTVDALNNLSGLIFKGSYKYSRGKYQKTLPLGDILQGLAIGTSKIGKDLRSKGYYTDSFRNTYQLLVNAGVAPPLDSKEPIGNRIIKKWIESLNKIHPETSVMATGSAKKNSTYHSAGNATRRNATHGNVSSPIYIRSK